MLHFEVELEVAYELSSRLHYLIIYIRLPDFVFFLTWYVNVICNLGGGGGGGGGGLNVVAM